MLRDQLRGAEALLQLYDYFDATAHQVSQAEKVSWVKFQ